MDPRSLTAASHSSRNSSFSDTPFPFGAFCPLFGAPADVAARFFCRPMRFFHVVIGGVRTSECNYTASPRRPRAATSPSGRRGETGLPFGVDWRSKYHVRIGGSNYPAGAGPYRCGRVPHVGRPGPTGRSGTHTMHEPFRPILIAVTELIFDAKALAHGSPLNRAGAERKVRTALDTLRASVERINTVHPLGGPDWWDGGAKGWEFDLRGAFNSLLTAVNELVEAAVRCPAVPRTADLAGDQEEYQRRQREW